MNLRSNAHLQSYNNDNGNELAQSAFASQSFFNDKSSHMDQTDNRSPILNDEAISLYSSYNIYGRPNAV